MRSINLISKDWIVLALIAMAEAALIWLLASVFIAAISGNEAELAPWVLATIVIVATLLPRALHDFGYWAITYSLLILAGLIVTVLLAVKTTSFPDTPWADSEWVKEAGNSLIMVPNDGRINVWPLILLCAAIWWRARVRNEPGGDSVVGTFRVGAIVALVALIANALAGNPVAEQSVSTAIVAFFSLSLLALAVTRQQPAHFASLSTFLGPIILPTVLIIVGATLLTGLLFSDLASATAPVLDPVIWLLSIIFQIFVLLLTGIALLIALPIIWIITRLPLDPGDGSQEIEPVSTGSAFDVAGRANEMPDIVRYPIAALVLFILFAGIARFVLHIGTRPNRGEHHESIAVDSGEITGRLRSWLSGLSRSSEGEGDHLASLRGDDVWQHTIRIRESYAEFLRRCKASGYPRMTASTSSKQAEIATRRTPESQRKESIVTMTERYEQARYANEPATATEAEAMMSAFETFDSTPETAD